MGDVKFLCRVLLHIHKRHFEEYLLLTVYGIICGYRIRYDFQLLPDYIIKSPYVCIKYMTVSISFEFRINKSLSTFYSPFNISVLEM